VSTCYPEYCQSLLTRFPFLVRNLIASLQHWLAIIALVVEILGRIFLHTPRVVSKGNESIKEGLFSFLSSSFTFSLTCNDFSCIQVMSSLESVS
jgi:hypothetical protein